MCVVCVYDATERDPIRYNIVMWWALYVLLPIPRPAANPKFVADDSPLIVSLFFFFSGNWPADTRFINDIVRNRIKDY